MSRTSVLRAGVLAAATLAAALAPVGAASAARVQPRLTAFDSCRDLVRYGRAGLARTGGGPGVPLRAGGTVQTITTPPLPPRVPAAGPVPVTTMVMPPAAAASADAAAGQDFSTTNVQETGIDEPDVVKTDGHHVYAVTDGTLRIVDVDGDALRLVGTLKLEGSGQRILLRGRRVLVAASQSLASGPPTAGPVVAPAIQPGGPVASVAPSIAMLPREEQTILTEVDVRDPAAPKVARTLTVRGTFVDARQTNGTVRIVLGSSPEPVTVEDGETPAEALAAVGRLDVVPRTVLRSRLSGRTFRRDLATCGQIRHPRAFSGTGLLTVMTIDLDRGLYSVDRDAVMAGAQVVYGSATSLYVASEKYVPALEAGTAVPAGSRTEIHRFDASKDGETRYAGSGDVPGFLLNQYAISENGKVLRVASTEQPPWQPGVASASQQSESGVSTLQVGDGRLTPIARVGGLGKGERVYAVRFIGATGYVVTFRQVDPLYVLDLSDPAAPKAVGELKIPGYSSYLHPVSSRLLLGVGRDGVASQVSLFDVSDPASPKRVALHDLGNGSTSAESDPHAFLYWPQTKLAVLPVQRYMPDPFTGAVGLRIGSADIGEVGRIDHATSERPSVPIDRTLVVGGRVLSLSYRGLGANRLDTLAPVGFAAFS